MIKMNRKVDIPIQEFTEMFSENPRVYYNMKRLEDLEKSLKAKIRSRDTQLISFLYNYLKFKPRDINRAVIEKLFDAAYVSPKFYITKEDGFTYTKDTKLQMIEAGILEDFNALHLNRTTMDTEHSKIIKVIQRSYGRNMVEGNNGPLTEIPFEVIPTRNRRYSTANENVIGMHRVINPSMEARKGCLLIQGDFPQIDGHGALNIYFKSSFTNELMNSLEDSYLVFKEIARWFPYLRAKDELDTLLMLTAPL